MEEDIFNQAYFKEREGEREDEGRWCRVFTSERPTFPSSFSAPASPILSFPDSPPVTENAQVCSPLRPVGIYGTELSLSVSSVYSVSAPKLK